MVNFSYVYVAIGAFLWGIIGFFVKELADYGFTPLQIVFLRAISALLFFFVWIVCYKKSLLRIQLKDSWYFIGTGIFSLTFFNWCYFTTIEQSSIAIAAILLYTAPAFVLFISIFVFKEKMTKQKIMALALTFTGCILVVGLFSKHVSGMSLSSLLIGLGAGFGYSLYSIFGKVAGKKYETLTISFYTFLLATILLFPLSGITSSAIPLLNIKVLAYTAGLGLFPTVFAYWFYTNGLREVEASKASIVSTIEPVVATIMGIFIYHEMISFVQFVGICLILLAVLLIQERNKENDFKKANWIIKVRKWTIKS